MKLAFLSRFRLMFVMITFLSLVSILGMARSTHAATTPWIQITAYKYNAGTATFTWAEHASTGSPTFTCKVDTKAASSCTSAKSYDIANGDVAVGKHTFTVTSSDGAVATQTFYISTLVSSTFTTYPADSISSTTSASFEWTTSGARANASTKCYLDSVEVSSCTSPKNLGTLAPGLHEFKLYVHDGKYKVYSARGFTVNSVAPPPSSPITVQIVSSPPAQTADNTANFAWTTTGTITGTTCILDSTSAPCTGTNINYAGPLSVGSHTFEVDVTDGTNTASDTRTWTVSDPAPTVVFTNMPDLRTPNTSATFEWTGSAPSGHSMTFTCTLDTGTETSCSSPKTYSSLSAGIHTLVVTVTDSTTGLTGTAQYRWSILSCTSGCLLGKGALSDPDGSDGGKYIAFQMRSGPSTIPGQPSSSDIIYRWNSTNDAIDVVSTDDGTTSTGPSNVSTNQNASISGDGNLVSFVSSSSSLYSTSHLPAGVSTKPTFVSGRYNAYLKNMTNGYLTLVSVGNSNMGAQNTQTPYISRDGRYVVFNSPNNLTASESDSSTSQQDFYRYDVANGTLTQVGDFYTGVGTNDMLNISDDGSQIVFATQERPTSPGGVTIPYNHSGVYWTGKIACSTPEDTPSGITYANTCDSGSVVDIKNANLNTIASSNYAGISGDGAHTVVASSSCASSGMYLDDKAVSSVNAAGSYCAISSPLTIGLSADGVSPVLAFTNNASGLTSDDTSAEYTPTNGTTYHYPQSHTQWYEMYEYGLDSDTFVRDSLTLANGCDWGAVPSTTSSCTGQTTGAGYQLNGKADQGTLSRDGSVSIYRNYSTNLDTTLNNNDSPSLTADIVAGPSTVLSIGTQ